MRFISIILSLIFAVGVFNFANANDGFKKNDIENLNNNCSIENKSDDCCKKSSKSEKKSNTTDCCDDECDGLMVCCIQLNVISEQNQISTPTQLFLNYKKYFNYSSFHLSHYLNEILHPPKLYNI
jgi:hypothetical protein